MPITQRLRSFQLFRKLKFSSQSGTGSTTDESQLEFDKMMTHVLDCLGALQCLMGSQYDPSKARVFWGAVATIAEIGMDAADGHIDRRHPGATHLLRAFPNDQKQTDGRSWLPLHWAAVTDEVRVEDVRNIAKADPLATVKGFNHTYSANPGHLIAAVRKPNMDVVKCLFNFYPMMASSRDSAGDMPIHYAARYTECVKMIQYLLQANPVCTSIQGDQNLIPLQCALYNEGPKRLDIVSCLINANPSAATVINADGDTALHKALDCDCSPLVIERLMNAYPNAVKVQNDVGHLPLHGACYSPSNTHNLKLLLNAYPEGARVVCASGHYPAHIAAEFGSAEMLHDLVTVFGEAINTGCVEDSNNTPLIKAVASCNYNTVKYICEQFPEAVKYQNEHGLTPMHFAVEGDSIEIYQLLYDTYPEVINMPDAIGRLPLHVFAQVHHDMQSERDKEADCVRFLLAKSPQSVSQPDNEGETPLAIIDQDNAFLKRLFLLADHSAMPVEFRRLNYHAKREGVFLAFAAINKDGIPNIFSQVRSVDTNLLKHVLSYL